MVLAGIVTYATDGKQFTVAPLDINASIKSGNIPGGQTTARLSARVDVDLDENTAALSGFTLDTLDAAVTGNLNAQRIDSPTPAISATLDAQGKDLGLLFKVAEIEPLASQLARLTDRSFLISATLDADLESGDVYVPTLSLAAPGITAGGALDARNMKSGRGTVEGNLNIRGERMAWLLTALDQADLAEVLQSVEIDTRVQGRRSGIILEPMSLQAVFAGPDIPGSPAAMTLNADTRLNLDRETLTFDGLTLEGLGLKTAGRVELADLFGKVSASGQLEVAPFNLRRLARQLRQELPETADGDAFTRVSLSGRFDLSDAGMNLERMELQLDDTRLGGEFSMTETALGPVTQFDLDVDQINLDRYLAPDSQAREASGDGAALLALAATDLNGELGIDRLVVSKVRLDGFRMRLSSRDGVLQADPVTAALYEGRLTASAVLDANPDLPALTLNTELTGIQAEPMLMDMTGRARLRGKGNFTAALTAQGASVAAMKSSLSGPMSLSFTEGAVAGFDLGRTLRQWKQFKKGQVIDVEDTAATDFTEFAGNPVARDGVIRMDDPDAEGAGVSTSGLRRAGGPAHRYHRLPGTGVSGEHLERRRRQGTGGTGRAGIASCSKRPPG